MPFVDTPGIRETVREVLSAYMTGPPKRGGIIIANEILKIDQIPRKINHETITRFVGGTHDTRPDNVETLYSFLIYRNLLPCKTDKFSNSRTTDPLFIMITEFFGVGDRNLEFCKSLVGTYTLHCRSEGSPQHVVVGAIKFDIDLESNAFIITERQENKRSGAVENWTGYYFSRSKQTVIIMHGQNKLDNVPKFYFLNAPNCDDNQVVTESRGVMFKLGSGLFRSKVLIRRDDLAFSKCDVFHRRRISNEILLEIQG